MNACNYKDNVVNNFLCLVMWSSLYMIHFQIICSNSTECAITCIHKIDSLDRAERECNFIDIQRNILQSITSGCSGHRSAMRPINDFWQELQVISPRLRWHMHFSWAIPSLFLSSDGITAFIPSQLCLVFDLLLFLWISILIFKTKLPIANPVYFLWLPVLYRIISFEASIDGIP